MATIRQIEANRRNAQKSTGPRTEAGKAVSRMNALKTGIDARSALIRGEKAAGLENLTAEYYDRFRPQTPDERFWVDTLIRSDWLLRRLSRADAQIWEYEMDSALALNTVAPLGHAYDRASRTFWRIQMRLTAAERSFQRALHELSRLKSTQFSFVPEKAPLPDVPAPPAASEPSPPSREPVPLHVNAYTPNHGRALAPNHLAFASEPSARAFEPTSAPQTVAVPSRPTLGPRPGLAEGSELQPRPANPLPVNVYIPNRRCALAPRPLAPDPGLASEASRRFRARSPSRQRLHPKPSLRPRAPTPGPRPWPREQSEPFGPRLSPAALF